MAISEFGALVSVLKAAREGLRALRQANLAADHKAAVDAAVDQLIDAQDRIASLQADAVSLREENAELKRQIREADDWRERKQQYKLVQTAGGAQVYAGGDPEHLVCPACMEKREIQVLQNLGVISGSWECPGCKGKYRVDRRTKSF